MCGMKLPTHSQTSTMLSSLKFGNGQIISSHTLLGLWLLIHAEVFLCGEMAHGRRAFDYPTLLIPWLLTPWLYKETGHHQLWYWLISPGISRASNQNSYIANTSAFYVHVATAVNKYIHKTLAGHIIKFKNKSGPCACDMIYIIFSTRQSICAMQIYICFTCQW